MGLLDKIKNLFTDEEEIIEDEEFEEIEEKPIKKRSLPTFMREKIEKEEKEQEIELTREIIHEHEQKEEKKEENPQFKFPFVFDEFELEEPKEKKEHKEIIEKKREEEKKQTNIYNATKKEKEKENKKFKPTPIISPVYGILDKNYKKDEVKSKPEHKQKLTRASSKKNDFETVRMKAYGTLSDEIKENMVDNQKEEDNIEVIDSNNLLYEITTDKDTTIANAEENYYDFGFSYEVPKRETKKESKKESEKIKIVNHNEDKEVKADKIEVKEPKKTKKEQTTVVEDADNETDLELTDDLFSLIDSMYDERNDE